MASPVAGMTLGALPALMLPQTRLAPARGSRRRESAAGSWVHSVARAKVRSCVRCGRDVWPPRPLSWTRTRSAAPVIEPSRRPTRPTSREGSQCRANVRETPESSAGGEDREGPSGHHLLGGLEHQADAYGESPVLRVAGESARGTQQRGGVHVVAARVRDTGHGRAPRVGGLVGDRQCVEVGTQGDDRPGAVADLRHQPGRVAAGRLDAELVQPSGHHVGGALLLPGQLGMGVQVTADVEQVGHECVDGRDEVRGRGHTPRLALRSGDNPAGAAVRTPTAPHRGKPGAGPSSRSGPSVLALGERAEEVAVEPGDRLERDALGAGRRALADVGAAAEALVVHAARPCRGRASRARAGPAAAGRGG